MRKLTMAFLTVILCFSGIISASAMSYNDVPVFNSSF